MTHPFKTGDRVRCTRANSTFNGPTERIFRDVEYVVSRAFTDEGIAYVNLADRTGYFYANRFALVAAPQPKVASTQWVKGPEAIDLKSLKVGDKVAVVEEFEVLAPADGEGDVRVRSERGPIGYLARTSTFKGTVRRAVRLEPGMAVTWGGPTNSKYELVALSDQQAVLKSPTGKFVVYRRDHLPNLRPYT
ncbi:hypothetical protein DMC25_06525 [Caulobacter sp. D4A]|uniref:hypothetical protein n=1 Tax=unclassified Caulobacter TaxID=2648921 RepID=UPI000D73416B|nr:MULTISPECIES: hypothetical protein [unclassified Caulobacter]PXA91203.1 hypothetical protein DMC25_06525 [Caulobacter sp. D4A]PXA96776.1 hypothetical protein DMC18_00495 [Caulobacter sp. D5]